MDLIAPLDRLNPLAKALVGVVLILAIGLGDLVTGYEVSFSLFYILPVSLVTWLMNRRAGVLASIVSAAVWLIADLKSGHIYSNELIAVWNSLIRLAIFLIITWLMADLRAALDREKTMARTDNLTGAVNSRHFLELLATEIDRLQRYQRPFTLAYIDLDNFKLVNDQFGHATGDDVLRLVVDYARRRLRSSDTVARLGGDEFVLLLPETEPEAAHGAVGALQAGLAHEMASRHWPVTVSVGAVSCSGVAPTPDELVRVADELMYEVKRAGKNAIRYATFEG